VKSRKLLRPFVAVVLCIAGFAFAKVTPYREGTVMLEAGGCRMVANILDKGNDEVSGSVILLHGLSANKTLMAYLARSFAEQNLRVFVPDLPGHGRTPGPFLFSRAESCAESFTRQLISRRAIEPSRTIVAGHSMGGAIAEQLAARIQVAGVVGISPAPMSTRHGIARYLLPFENVPAAPAKTLVISGSWEPAAVRQTAQDLTEGPAENTDKYVVIPHATHVSLLFDPRAARASQVWAANVLGLAGSFAPASLLPLVGSVVGLIGVLLLAGPFIRETLGVGAITMSAAQRNARKDALRGSGLIGATDTAAAVAKADWGASGIGSSSVSRFVRSGAEIACASAVAVGILQKWQPLGFVRLFDGGYFASFLLIVGLGILAGHYKQAGALLDKKWSALVVAALVALLLFFLITVWLDATFSESWLSWSRWGRFPALLMACFIYFSAEELLVPLNSPNAFVRNFAALALRGVGWLAMLFAIFVLHRGPILLLLLAPYLAVFCILQLAGMHIVRTETHSPAAAALFGAILLAGFSLVIFPVT
jgi:pimeloyl-ACP methyl ester carboxylesterase